MIIGIVQGKGGVAKTTTAISIGHSLTSYKKSVLLIDLDPQQSLTYALGQQAADGSIADTLLDGEPICITKTGVDGLSIVRGSERLSSFDINQATAKTRTSVLAHALAKVKDRFDYILIDCPPTTGLLVVNAIHASDRLLIPIRPDYMSAQGLAGLLRSVDEIRDNLKSSAKLVGLLPVMVDSRLRSAREMLDILRKQFGKQVFKSEIPLRVSFSECPSHAQSIFQYARHSIGAAAYSKATKELLTRLHD